MLADTFTNTDRETYGKSRLLSNLKGGKWDVNGISDVKGEGLRRHRLCDQVMEGQGRGRRRTRIDRTERWTDTWVKTPRGDWQCVASQQTASKK